VEANCPFKAQQNENDCSCRLFLCFQQLQTAAHLHQHVLMLRVVTVVGFPAQLLHLCHQTPVAHNLQQAGLQRDAQPGNTQGRGSAVCLRKLKFINEINCPIKVSEGDYQGLSCFTNLIYHNDQTEMLKQQKIVYV